MKKSIITIITLSIISTLTLFSCSSNKDMQPISEDSYDLIESDMIASPEDSEIETKKAKSSTPKQVQNNDTSLKTYYEEGLKDLITFGNKDKFIRSDVSSVFSTTVTGSIKQQKSTIYISTKDELAGFGSSYMAAYYILLMNADSRKKLSNAKDMYLSDFNNKKLARKNRKSFKIYGSIDVTLNWGAIQSSTPSFGSGSASLGYEFVKNSPYFVITCFPLYNEYYDIVGESTSRESMMIKYYFTKAQLNELVDMISEDKIAAQLYGVLDFVEDVESDEYSDNIEE